MSNTCTCAGIAFVFVSQSLLAGSPAELIGIGRLSGMTSDLSGQTTVLENGEPHDRFGGISALEYTGQGGRYVAVSDRGPDDGATGYLCRFHLLNVHVDADAKPPVSISVIGSTMLSNSDGLPFSGMSKAY